MTSEHNFRIRRTCISCLICHAIYPEWCYVNPRRMVLEGSGKWTLASQLAPTQVMQKQHRWQEHGQHSGRRKGNSEAPVSCQGEGEKNVRNPSVVPNGISTVDLY
jgi:hypothetical protein